MNKQQFIEKKLKEFNKQSVIAVNVQDFLQSALSECWDMAREEGEKNEDRALEERNNAEDWAEQLANDISAVIGIDIGEHSNLNNPWANALEALHTYFDSLTSQKEGKA